MLINPQPSAKEAESRGEARAIQCEPSSPPLSPRAQQLEKMAAAIAAQAGDQDQRRYEAMSQDENT